MSRHMEEKEQKRSQEDKQRINMLVKRVKELEAKAGKGMVSFPIEFIKYSRLSLSLSRRDPLKQFETSVLRHTRFAELRKIPIKQPNFTNEHVIRLL